VLLFGKERLSGARTCSRSLWIVRVWGLGSGALGSVGLNMSSVKGTEMEIRRIVWMYLVRTFP
jgi:hypothetical protein